MRPMHCLNFLISILKFKKNMKIEENFNILYILFIGFTKNLRVNDQVD